MNIIVCIKQVPNTEEIKIDTETNTLMREGVSSIINPYDLHSIEAALQIREKMGGTVIAITMGPPQAEDALRAAISMGVDDVRLISDRAFAGADTLSTSYTLCKAIEKLRYDIIFCGKQAIDGDTAQVGPEVAEFLNIPHIAYVKKIDNITTESIKVHRLLDDGYDVVESSLPVLLTVVRELNLPRLPSLKGKMTAKKAVVVKMDLNAIGAEEKDVGLKGSPTKVKDIFSIKAKTDRRMLQGNIEEQVDILVQELFSQ
ncbi:electron transfer flavoprotein subunit beta/FixA family protein [Thermodesulfovibrionales bacterium]|nr:electron transfer flavoprotein subunit beta/FixA family protein [Thermodesulfovibrionales bacterium]MCL0046726.1 electron transfer flavoprotein subunit beta/FixA family protein [Thermodesulfovibrionales bacterium]MCL0051107.1 electron transfer flavoprotein subunit beta/FixA family protein [Thermodesulfovibrionales bacterium]MCL0061513.1 electron transfer flavoprotein subunit beta/FixA family protein [Thermodesulfovibrionales bacterium]